MCLVEVNNALGVSCALPLLNDMRIYTDNKRVRKAREGVLQFLLVNHPLDCPICDQGGECDLQDISSTFGIDRGRYYEYKKRSVDNLNTLGPLIKTIMTRCIHCSRCVRYINEVSGVSDLGIIGRGSAMEIGTFIERFIDDELSGNIIDLCPVGALTAMPSAFVSRSWELISVNSIDVLDSLSSSIRLDIANNSVVKIVPFLDEVINEEWITNKTRFCYDSFSIQRLSYPKLRLYSKLVVISWGCVFNLFFDVLLNYSFKFLESFCGPFSDLDTVSTLKFFFNSFGSSNLNYFDNLKTNFDFRFLFLLNNSLFSLEKSNVVLLLGSNLRLESPILNSRLRKNFLNKKKSTLFFSIGLSLVYLTFPVINMGNNLSFLKTFIESKYSSIRYFFISDFLNFNLLNFNFKFLNKISVFGGMSLLTRLDSSAILNSLFYFFKKLFSFNTFFNLNFISVNLGRISAMELVLPQV